MNNYSRERIKRNARCMNDRRRRRIQMWQLAPVWDGEEEVEDDRQTERSHDKAATDTNDRGHQSRRKHTDDRRG